MFFKNFYDTALHSVKFDQQTKFISDLTPLENAKKDFSSIIEELINKDELNVLLLNNIKNNKLSALNIPKLSLDSRNDEMSKRSKDNNFRNSTGDLKNNIHQTSTNFIKLNKTNDFGNEKREEKEKTQILTEREFDRNSRKPKDTKILDYFSSKNDEESSEINVEDMINDSIGIFDNELENLFSDNTNQNLGNQNNKRKKNFIFEDKSKLNKKRTKK